MKLPIVICGATGHVGSKIAETLLGAGEPIRVVGRERVRLGPLAGKGAEPFPGDMRDRAFLEKAFAEARGAFVLIPPKLDEPNVRAYQDEVAEALSSALSGARVPRVVVLSSIGAHLPEGNGPIRGLHELEAKLDARVQGAVAHLRAAFFMENHLFSIPLIRSQGICGSPIRPDIPIPMVATKDIAGVAVRLLLDEKVAGHLVRYLLGPRDVSMTEVAAILGEAVGNPRLRYVQFPEAEARKAMIAMGMSGSVAEAMLEMYRAFNEGGIRPTQARSTENSTPTTLEEFARTAFSRAYKSAA